MEEIRVDMREMNEKDMALYAKHDHAAHSGIYGYFARAV